MIIITKKVNGPIYLTTMIQITGILNKLKSAGAISEEKKTISIPFNSPQQPRPRYFYMLPKIHKEDSCWTKSLKTITPY